MDIPGPLPRRRRGCRVQDREGPADWMPGGHRRHQQATETPQGSQDSGAGGARTCALRRGRATCAPQLCPPCTEHRAPRGVLGPGVAVAPGAGPGGRRRAPGQAGAWRPRWGRAGCRGGRGPVGAGCQMERERLARGLEVWSCFPREDEGSRVTSEPLFWRGNHGRGRGPWCVCIVTTASSLDFFLFI